MICPQFEILEYGSFDSSVKFPRMKISDPRTVTEFEIELYTADFPGATFLNGRAIPFRCGRLIVAKPGQIRQSVLPFKCLYLHLATESEDLAARLSSLPDAAELADLSEPLRIFYEILSLQAQGESESVLRMQSLVCALLDRLLRDLAPHFRGANAGYLHQRILLAAEKEMRESPAEPHTLKSLAAKANLSPIYFHRVFTDYFGKTPHRYLLDCRIAAAKLMLVTEESSITEIAENCGFSSQAHFNAQFKANVGQTPLQYRKAMLSRVAL